MNERAKIKAPAAPESVTTGPIVGSRKVYASPKGHADIRVPFREIALSDPNEPPVRVYDASGPYTEADARVDLAAGLAPVREAWISCARLRCDRRPRDQAGGQRLGLDRAARAPLPGQANACAPARPASSSPSSNSPAPESSPRKWSTSPIARTWRARRRSPAPRNGSPTAKASARRSPNSSRPNSCARKWRAAARSSPPTSTTSSSSRWRSAATSWSRSTPTSATAR